MHTIKTKNENDYLHSFNDEPAIIRHNGIKLWYMDGKRHRGNDLPAVLHPSGLSEWYMGGKRHRETDAAIIYPDGYKEYYLEDYYYTFEEWIKLTPLPEEQKLQLILEN